MSGASSPLIVGVDGSEGARDALALAARLAEPDQHVLPVHVHRYGELSDVVPGGEYENGGLRTVAETTLCAVHDAVERGTQRELRLISKRSPAAALHEVATKTGACLIVVGSSQRSGLGRVLAGSVGESTLLGSPVPVAIAPGGYASTVGNVTTVACGFDGSPESEAALRWAHALARRRGARLWVLAVHTPVAFGGVPAHGPHAHVSANRALRRSLEQRTRAAIDALPEGGHVHGRILDGDVWSQLTAASADVDLLALGSRGYGPVRSVLLGSTSRALVRSAACPVVVLCRGADGTRRRPESARRDPASLGP